MTEIPNPFAKSMTGESKRSSQIACFLPSGAVALLCTLVLGSAGYAQNVAQSRVLGQVLRPGAAQQSGAQATAVSLSSPAGLAYDAAGNLFIATPDDQLIRKVDLQGVITTVAGNREQGFGGDGGAATAAILDSPDGVAVDASGNLFIADTHNNRIREVMASTGVITTVAGTGIGDFSGDNGAALSATLNLPTSVAVDASGGVYVADTGNHRIRKITGGTIKTVAGDGEQFFSGDGGLATAAGLDSPSGIAVDGAGNLYVGDTHNGRVRVIAAATGIISTVAGTGVESFGGDGGSATAAGLARPRGVAVDSGGKVFIADSDNNRIRTVDGATIATFAGTGEQGFSGDTTAAVSAILDTPRAAAVFQSGSSESTAFADSNNDRVRAVNLAGVVNTIAGLGATAMPSLVLSGATSVVYGTGSLTATYSNRVMTGSGSVTLLDGAAVLGVVALSSNSADFVLPPLAVGTHFLAARYSGDSTNAAIASGVFVVTVSPATAVATAASVSVAFGLPIPVLTGTLSGVLSSDVGTVSVVLSTTAMRGSSPGTYPISASLVGSAAANYSVSLSPASGSVVIGSAATTIGLTSAPSLAYAGLPLTVTATVAAATAGTVGVPAGPVAFFDGSSTIGTGTLDQTGKATLVTTPGVGVHSFTATYAASVNFSGSASASPLSVTVLPAPDFSLAPSGISSQTVVPGSSVSYGISVIPSPTPFAGTVTFSVSGLPAGAKASFAPSSVVPGSSTTGTVMTIQTAPLSAMIRLASGMNGTLALALLLLPMISRRNGRFARSIATVLLCLGTADASILVTGCASSNGFFGQPAKTYPLTVTGTSTSVTGATLARTTTVILTLQ